MKLYLNKTLDKYDPLSRAIANCLEPMKKKPWIPTEAWYFLFGLGVGWVTGICFFGLALTGG